MTLNLNARITGSNLAELNSKADAVCRAFYGTAPFQIIEQSWASATADQFDADGNVTGFMFDMQAQPAPTV